MQNEDHRPASHPEEEVRGAVFILASPRLLCYLSALDVQLFYFQVTVTSFREGNGTPLQYSCLENPMDGGAW